MKKINLLLLLASCLFAGEYDMLSTTKKEITNLKTKQILQKEQTNKYNWLSNINLSASIQENQDDITTTTFGASVSQDIFRFGGITAQIEYSKHLKDLDMIELKTSNKDDLNTLYSTVIDIKLNEIALQQNTLNLQNYEIDIRHKKSEYKAGQIGISDLNEAIMSRNSLKDTQKTLELSKLNNINSLRYYTDAKYENIDLPSIKLMTEDEYIKNSYTLKYYKKTIDVNDKLYKIQKSNYLPVLSLDATYSNTKTDNSNFQNSYNYGLSLNLPLSYTSSNAIEQTRLDYLVSKQELQEQKLNENILYQKASLSIKNYQERIELALKDIALYDELLQSNKEEYEAGYKTIDDVVSLENSKKIRELDIKSYELSIKKEVYNLL
jgi:outer membrane protein TolC